MKIKITTVAGSALVGLAIASSGHDAHAAEYVEKTTSDEQPDLVVKSELKYNNKGAVEAKQKEYDITKQRQNAHYLQRTEVDRAISNKRTEIAQVDAKIAGNLGTTPAVSADKIDNLKKQQAIATTSLKDKQAELQSVNEQKKVNEQKVTASEQKINEVSSQKAKVEEQIKVQAQGTQEVKATQAKIDSLNIGITKTQKEVDAKKEQVRIEQNNIAKNEELRKELTAKKDTQQAKLDKVTAEYNKANSELDKIKQQASGNYFGESKIETRLTLDQNFVSALKVYLANTTTANLQKVIEAEKKTKIRYPEYGTNNNKYTRGDTPVDILNLTDNQKVQLSQYFTMINNQVRAQFGKSPQHVNLNVQKFVNDITKKTQDDKYKEYHHYHRAINIAAYKNGIDTYDHGNQYNRFESLDYGNINSRGATMKTLYDAIYISIQRFYLEGQMNNHYLHAAHLLGDADVTAVGYAFISSDNGYVHSVNKGFYSTRLSVVSINKLYMHDGWRLVNGKYVANYDRYEAKFGAKSGANIAPINPSSVNLNIVDESVRQAVTQKVRNLNFEKQRLTDEVNTLKKELERIPVQSGELKRKELQAAEQKLAQLKGELDNAQAELDKQIKKQSTSVHLATLTARRDSLTQQLITLRSELEHIKDELARQKVQLEKLGTATEIAQKVVDKITSDLQSELSKVEQAKRLQGTREELITSRNKLVKELKDLEAKADEYTKSGHDINDMVLRVEKELRDLKNAGSYYVKHATLNYAPVLEVSEFDIKSLETPKVEHSNGQDAPVLDVPEFDIKSLETPKVEHSNGQEASVLEVPEFDIRSLETPKVEHSNGQDAPVLEVPEFDIKSLETPKVEHSNGQEAPESLETPKVEHSNGQETPKVTNEDIKTPKTNAKPTVEVTKTSKSKVEQRKLPNTGDAESVAGMGLLLVVAGFLGYRRRV